MFSSDFAWLLLLLSFHDQITLRTAQVPAHLRKTGVQLRHFKILNTGDAVTSQLRGLESKTDNADAFRPIHLSLLYQLHIWNLFYQMISVVESSLFNCKIKTQWLVFYKVKVFRLEILYFENVIFSLFLFKLFLFLKWHDSWLATLFSYLVGKLKVRNLT